MSPAFAGTINFEIVSGAAGSGQIWADASFDGVGEKCFLDTGGRISVLRNGSGFSNYPVVGKDVTTGVTGREVLVDLIRIANSKVGDLSIQDHVMRRQDKKLQE